jgi:hypothetical protein
MPRIITGVRCDLAPSCFPCIGPTFPTQLSPRTFHRSLPHHPYKAPSPTTHTHPNKRTTIDSFQPCLQLPGVPTRNTSPPYSMTPTPSPHTLQHHRDLAHNSPHKRNSNRNKPLQQPNVPPKRAGNPSTHPRTQHQAAERKQQNQSRTQVDSGATKRPRSSRARNCCSGMRARGTRA